MKYLKRWQLLNNLNMLPMWWRDNHEWIKTYWC